MNAALAALKARLLAEGCSATSGEPLDPEAEDWYRDEKEDR